MEHDDDTTERARSRGAPTHRTSLTFQHDEDLDTLIEIEDVASLVAWIQKNPEQAFRMMQRRENTMNALHDELEDLKTAHTTEVFQLKERIARLKEHTPATQDQAMEEAYANLRQELTAAQRARDDAVRERDSVITAMRLMGPGGFSNRTTPMPEERPRKSTKMPDPPLLSDGKAVKFKPWKTEMKRKFRLNQDHYPTTAHQLAYVVSRCEGKALSHISPRMEDDSTTPYQTVDDVFDHLQTVFYDPNQKQVARDEYLDLKMDPKQDFIDFLADFTRLAEESEQPMELRKKDLYRKLPNLLQNQVMIYSGDEAVTLEQFTHKCQIASRLISQQVASRNANKNSGRNSSSNQNNTNKNNTVSSTGSGSNSSSSSRLTDAEKATLMKEGKCFYCREPGHVSRSCPKKKDPGASLASATPEESSKKSKNKTAADLEAAEESDSGKESA